MVRRFLKDVEDGTYDTYAELGGTEFPLHNPAMRKALRLQPRDPGVLVTNVVPTSSMDGILQSGDVLVSLDGKPVDSAGHVVIDGESLNFNEVVERKFASDKVAVRFLRNGSWNDVDITLKTLPWIQMQAIQYGKRPRYLVFAGLVFQPLDTNLFATAKFDDVTVRRLYSDYVAKGIFQTRRDIVMLTRVESDPLTTHLGEYAGRAVDKINGTLVRDLRHASELLNPANAPEFHVIELFGADRPLIIRASDVAAANERVKKNYGIPVLSNFED
ncbi:MAG: PDZ domain-containing protein [Verrucomicrobiota bacterium]